MYRFTRAFVALLLFSSSTLFAQKTVVSGKVIDAKTKEGLPSVTVFFPGTNVGTYTEDDGSYILSIDGTPSVVRFSSIGYKTVTKKTTPGETVLINIQISEDTKSFNEVVVKSGKRAKYRNKGNPAVELIREVIDHKDKNKAENYDLLQYQEYEKLQFSLSNAPEKLKKNLMLRKYKFIASSLDTTSLEGKAILPIFMQENIADIYYRKQPEKNKRIVTAEKKVTFDESFIDNKGMTAYLKHVYQDIDIYKNNITIVTNQFLSPIADLAPTFYKFYIIDTFSLNGYPLVQMAFGPRNKADFLFEGLMYITLDGNYSVQRVEMKVNKQVNLNWVKHLSIQLQFEQSEDKKYHLSNSKLSADFGLTKNGDAGMFGERTISVKNYQIAPKISDSIFTGDPIVYLKSAKQKNDEFWEENRHDTLSTSEKVVYENIDSLQNTKSFKRVMNTASFLLAGYAQASPYIEIGPFNTFYSFNPVEGFRGRVGGRTTPKMSKNIYFETYAAYGFKDEKLKYYLGATYSFTNRSMFEFPTNKITANFQRDTKIPGQELQFIQEDNIFLSLKRGVNDKWLYNDIYRIDYLNENSNHFSYQLGFKNWKQQAAGGLRYLNDATQANIESLTTSELSLELRWAPHEEFYQGKLYRVPLPNRYPIYTLRAIAGFKDLLGGQYNYQNITGNVQKRIYLSQLGYLDVTLEGGVVLGKVPFPLLDIHRANQSYSYQLQSYNLMNFLEFVSDHYASVQIDQTFNGFLFNKIPLIKKLKFREFASVKVLYGGLRPENTPNGSDSSLLSLPTDANGNLSTFTLQKDPYIEGSVGIGNILKFFRIDVVRRFTYIDNPNVANTGIRVRFKFDF
ncbi:MAG: carboxypeptidase-like regulatory domain-containing protein [Chitinophagaceae bacterium]|nr:carboxypeptidase-like regulatory domain-containing protein [Chitinophagaceae bacterium]